MADRQRFLVRFWGVRGSYPTPGSHTLRHGGNTACIEVQAGSHTLIFDAGSGIIGLGNDVMRRTEQAESVNLALFITHAHSDHLVGFPFFAPLFDPRTNIDFFGPQLGGLDIEQLVTPLMSPPYFPVDIRLLPSRRIFHRVVDDQYIYWKHDNPMVQMSTKMDGASEVCVRAKFTQYHPIHGALIYRIEYEGRSIVYLTDVEWQRGCEADFLAFVEKADLLIHDAQYTGDDYKQGFGHSTIEMATEFAHLAHVQELVLFHHEPTYDDNQLDRMEAEAQKRFAHTRSAYEGMEVDLLAK